MNNIDIHIKPKVENFTKEIFYLLYDVEAFEDNFKKLEKAFVEIGMGLRIKDPKEVWTQFKPILKTVQKKIASDAIATEKNDPAAQSVEEVYLAYPGFFAISIYRVSHELYKLQIPLLPRMMSEYAHSYTGTDIHPGATIGESFFIDHATGIVIGETVHIGDNVKIYQGVTLGAFHIKKELASKKRHPTIENNVTIYANATILGGETVIGENSIIGASVWLTKSVPANSFASYKSEIRIKTRTEI